MKLAIILPTYNEILTLPIFLNSLYLKLPNVNLILIVDDSDRSVQLEMQKELDRFENIVFIRNNVKNGRGAAVRQGMAHILKNHEYITHVIEADCDGSHRIDDIVTMAKADPKLDFIIGSRYLSESKIIGWSWSRKFLSKLLNNIIPNLLNIETSDITNGLRRYSKKALIPICQEAATSSSFIYLSEQALILKRSKLTVTEIPIVFESRIAGRSSVGSAEIINSIIGLYKIIKMRKRNENV